MKSRVCLPSPKIVVGSPTAIRSRKIAITALERGLLPRPVDVRESQRDVAGAEEPVPTGDVPLGCELRDPIRRDRPQRGLLDRRPVALSVDRTAGRAEDDVRAARPRRL